MALLHVSTSVRDVQGTVAAVRALEMRLLAALVLLVVGQTALAAEGAVAIRAGEPLAQRPRVHIRVDRRPHRRHRRRHRRRRRRVRLENVAPHTDR